MKYLHFYNNVNEVDTSKKYLSPGIIAVRNTNQSMYANLGLNGEYEVEVVDGKVRVKVVLVTLTLVAGRGGIVIGGGQYLKGSAVTITASPAVGYVFSSWSDGDTNATRSIVVNEDMTLTATFDLTILTKYQALAKHAGLSNYEDYTSLNDFRNATATVAINGSSQALNYLQSNFTVSSEKDIMHTSSAIKSFSVSSSTNQLLLFNRVFIGMWNTYYHKGDMSAYCDNNLVGQDSYYLTNGQSKEVPIGKVGSTLSISVANWEGSGNPGSTQMNLVYNIVTD